MLLASPKCILYGPGSHQKNEGFGDFLRDGYHYFLLEIKQKAGWLVGMPLQKQDFAHVVNITIGSMYIHVVINPQSLFQVFNVFSVQHGMIYHIAGNFCLEKKFTLFTRVCFRG